MKERVWAFLERVGERGTASFPRPGWGAEAEALSLELYAWQVRHNPDYRAFSAGAEPGGSAEIPAVPSALFQEASFTCFPPEEARFRFRTSGTTTGRPGEHRLREAGIYDLSARLHFRGMAPHAPPQALSLVPSPAQAPHASLSHMVAALFARVRYVQVAELSDPRGLLGEVSASGPVFLACTALALLDLLEALAGAGPTLPALPAGSMVMITGGFKGRGADTSPGALRRAAAGAFGERTAWIEEYGMTELRSQLWTEPRALSDVCGVEGPLPMHPPPWLRPLVVDPWSGALLEPGVPGQIRFVDLANHDTVVAIETSDQGRLRTDGSLLLEGRLPGAVERGCSLTWEDLCRRGRR